MKNTIRKKLVSVELEWQEPYLKVLDHCLAPRIPVVPNPQESDQLKTESNQ